MIIHPHPPGIAEGQHARLAPSSASRWLSCPASITLTETNSIPERPPGAAALAGTIIHYAFEGALRGGPRYLSDTESFELVMDGEMAEPTAHKILTTAIESVHHLVQRHQVDEIWLEERLYPAIRRRDVWGTCDCLAYSRRLGRAIIIDLKTGLWPVAAKDNTQGLVYAVGAFDFLKAKGLPPQRDMVFAIIQPRLRQYPDSWTIERATLERFRARLIERAATTDDSDAAPIAGEWCRFCRARSSCPLITVNP